MKDLEKTLGNRLKENVDLAPYTTFKMGGKAEFYFEAYSKDDLIKGVATAKKFTLPLTILGGGSNIIIIKEKINGLVLKNLYIAKEIVKETGGSVEIKVSSGYITTKLAQEAINNGFSGFEYFIGLPGTIGGALFMNSKWQNGSKEKKSFVCIGDHLLSAEIIDNCGKIKKVNRDYFQFSCGQSILQKTKEIVLSATFLFKKENKELLKKIADETLLYRQKTQPFGVFSAGCFFRNPKGLSAGQLIEKIGLKGFSVGNFYVSPKHGNFIIHKGAGDLKDLKELIRIIKERVKQKFGIELEEEVKFIN